MSSLSHRLRLGLLRASLLLLALGLGACGGGGTGGDDGSTGDGGTAGANGTAAGDSTTGDSAPSTTGIDTSASLAELAAAYGGDLGSSPPGVSPSSADITAIRFGPTPADASVTVSWGGDTLKMVSLEGDMPDWLTVDDGILDTRPRTFDFRLRHTDMDAGTYTLDLAFVDIDNRITGDVIRGVTPFTLTLQVSDAMTLDQDRLTFHRVHGQLDTGSAQSVSVLGIDADWRARSYYDWLSLENTTGTHDEPLQVSLSGAALALPPGVHSGTIEVATGTSDRVTLPVDLVVEPRRLDIADHGLAFSAWPGEGGLREQRLAIRDSARTTATPWTASSDAGWLQLVALDGDNAIGPSGSTASGLTGQSLVASVAADSLSVGYHAATISVSSSDTDVANTETIAVGFTVLDTAPATGATVELSTTSKVVGLVADPVRPLVYVSEGLADIRVFDVYSGQEQAPFDGIGTDIRDLEISDDGHTLYAVDVTVGTPGESVAGYETPASVLVIDAATGTVIRRIGGAILPTCANGCSTQSMASKILDIVPVRIDGRQLLASNRLVLIDPDSGDVLLDFADELAYPVNCCGAKDPLIEASADGRQLYVMNTGVSPGTLHRVDLATSCQVAETVRARYVASVDDVGNRDVAISPDGTRVCAAIANNGTIPCFATDTDTHTDTGTNTGLTAADHLADVDVGFHVASTFGSDGRLYTGQNAYGFSDESIGVYDLVSGARLGGTSVPIQLSDRQLVLSGDARRIVTRSNGYRTLMIQAVPGY